jgi:hypothetical protein
MLVHALIVLTMALANFQTVISTSTRVEGPDVLATSENMFVHNKSKNGKTQRKLNPLDASGELHIPHRVTVIVVHTGCTLLHPCSCCASS